jgi:competence protein ComEC
MPLSVVCAAVMISTYALLSLANHGRMSLNALALAAIIILMVSPDSLWNVGFQLSFAAMTAILMVQPLIERLIAPAYLFDRILLRWAWGLATVSLAAQVGTAPLVAYYFGRLPVYFLLTNFIVIPGATVIIWLVLVALLTIPYTSLFSGALLTAVDWLNAALAFVAGRLPCPSIDGLKPSTLQTTMVYVVIVALYLIVVRYDKHF